MNIQILTDFWQTSDVMSLVYWGAAGVSSLFFLIQMLLLFLGFDGDHDFSGGDAAFDLDGMQLISVKTITCFFLGFGWTGVLFAPLFASPLWLGVCASLVGLGFMLLIAFLLKQVLRFTQDNSFSFDEAVGLTAQVYVPIPADANKMGKIMVSVKGTLRELPAYTTLGETLPTGTFVRILEAEDEEVLRVEKLHANPS